MKPVSKIIRKEIILPTNYGNLSVISPVISSQFKKDPKESIIHRDVSYIDNNSSVTKTKISINRCKDFFLFTPESHYYNSSLIFQSLRKQIFADYYGDTKKANNPFKNCKTPKDIFNLSRNIKINVKKELSRFGFKVFKSGELDIKHNDESFLNNNVMLTSVLKEYITKHEREVREYCKKLEDLKFNKHDYFISFEKLEGALTYLRYTQKGFTVKVLNNKKIFPLHGVFNPSREDYLDLFNNYLQDNLKEIRSGNIEKACDLGCGSGVLSYIMAANGIKKVLALDKDPNAVGSCKSNSESLGFIDNIQSIHYDLISGNLLTNDLNTSNDNINKDFIKERFGLFDLIVCNPPWLNANYIFSQNEFENAVYDPNHAFLNSAFEFASKQLYINLIILLITYKLFYH